MWYPIPILYVCVCASLLWFCFNAKGLIGILHRSILRCIQRHLFVGIDIFLANFIRM
jgi:hypothetical protein